MVARFQPFLCRGLLDDPALCQGYVVRERLLFHLGFPCPSFPPAELGHSSKGGCEDEYVTVKCSVFG